MPFNTAQNTFVLSWVFLKGTVFLNVMNIKIEHIWILNRNIFLRTQVQRTARQDWLLVSFQSCKKIMMNEYLGSLLMHWSHGQKKKGSIYPGLVNCLIWALSSCLHIVFAYFCFTKCTLRILDANTQSCTGSTGLFSLEWFSVWISMNDRCQWIPFKYPYEWQWGGRTIRFSQRSWAIWIDNIFSKQQKYEANKKKICLELRTTITMTQDLAWCTDVWSIFHIWRTSKRSENRNEMSIFFWEYFNFRHFCSKI